MNPSVLTQMIYKIDQMSNNLQLLFNKIKIKHHKNTNKYQINLQIPKLLVKLLKNNKNQYKKIFYKKISSKPKIKHLFLRYKMKQLIGLK